MDKIRQYHGDRIRTLLRTSRTSNSHHDSSYDNGISSVNAGASISVKSELSPLEVPEIFLLILEYIPNHTYPVLCCVSKLWCKLTKPQIWKSISLSGLSLPLIAPYFSSNIDSTKRMDVRIPANFIGTRDFRDLSWLPEYFVGDRAFLKLTTIRIHGFTEARRERSFLFDFIRRCPNLKEIDLRMSQLSSFALDLLYECPHLESLAFDLSYWIKPYDSSSSKIVPLHSGGGFWPNLRHLHIRDLLDVHIFATEMTAHLLKSSFCLDSLILEGYSWKPNLFWHVVAPGFGSEDDVESRKVAEEERPESMVSSLKLRHYDHRGIDFDKMPKLTKLEIVGDDTASIGIGTCGRLTELTLFECHLKDLCIILSHTRLLRKLSVGKFVDNRPMNRESAWAPRWKCLGLEELTLFWRIPSNRERLSPVNYTSMVLWEEIGNLKQLSILRLRYCRAICDTSISPCPLVMLKDLNQLRHLEIIHSSMWILSEVKCVAEYWPRLSLLECHVASMTVFHWSWLRQMRPFLSMETPRINLDL